jgi:hypothetical protein
MSGTYTESKGLDMNKLLRSLVIVGSCTWTQVALAERPKVKTVVPEDGDTQVDPKLKELRVVFDQPMAPDGMSVVGGGPKFPKFTGKARWENDRTFVWTWRLEPEHDYWISLNSDRFTNFRGKNGQPLVPHPIAFRTAKAGAATASSVRAANHRQAVEHLRRAIDEDYSYRDLRVADWDAQFQQFAAKLQSSETPRQFAELAAQLLSPAQDIHLWLKVEDETIATFQRSAPWNVARATLPQRIPQWHKRNSTVASGLFDDGIRYLFIGNWPGDSAAELEPAFQVMGEAAEAGSPLIIDVRANGGGSELAARQFAGCFVDRPIVYAKHLTRQNGQFSEPLNRELQPNRARPRFRGRVAVLMGQGTVSSSEAFVMMVKQVPGCTLIGDSTAGSSGNPKPLDLGNGVVAFVPSWKQLSLDGTCLEGKGVAPDVAVKTSPSDLEKSDPVLEEALRLLRQK